MASWRRTIESLKVNSGWRSWVLWDEPLSKHTTFRIGGEAECFIVVNHQDDLKKIIKLANQENIPIFIIGQGSNLLISEQGLQGIIIKLGKAFIYTIRNNNQVTVGGATPLSKLLNYAFAQSLSGIEFVWGIPATFGGAIVSNVGAFSQDIGSKVLKINGLSANGEQVTLNRNQLEFSYRKSNLPYGFIVTEGLLDLKPSEQNLIRQKIEEYRAQRRTTQPKGASAGSVFKNPSLAPAGRIIDESNLKGIKIGNACISKKHGNFIINQGHAHFIDVYELIQIIKSTVESKTGTILQEEIQILPKSQEVKKWQRQKKS
jgi:UDP-N-acetylmuramate dehydrogenase